MKNTNLKSFIVDQKKYISSLKNTNQKMVNDMNLLKNKMNNINLKNHLYFKKKIEKREKKIVNLNNQINKINYEKELLQNKIYEFDYLLESKKCCLKSDKKKNSSSYDLKSSEYFTSSNSNCCTSSKSNSNSDSDCCTSSKSNSNSNSDSDFCKSK